MIKIICFKDNMREPAFEYACTLPSMKDGDHSIWLAWERYHEDVDDYCDDLKMYVRMHNYGNMIVACPEAMSSNDEVARLADEIVRYYWDNETTIAIVTASPTFVNRIGRRVYEHNELMNAIEVLSISKEDEVESGSFEPKHHTFDKKGRLLGWRRGFLDPDDDGTIELVDANTLRVEVDRKEAKEWMFRIIFGSKVDYRTLDEVKANKQKVIAHFEYYMAVINWRGCTPGMKERYEKALAFVRQL